MEKTTGDEVVSPKLKGDETPKLNKEASADAAPQNLARFSSGMDLLLLIVSILSNILAGALLPAFMYIFGDLINTVGGAPSDKSYTYYVKVMAILGGISFVACTLGSACIEWAAERVLRNLRDQYIVAVMRQEMGWFDLNDAGTLSARLNENCVQIRDGIGVKFGQLFLFGAMFVGGFILG
eukprot:Lankesteria_metandrocarpae@DN4134_c0_g1_i2.p1